MNLPPPFRGHPMPFAGRDNNALFVSSSHGHPSFTPIKFGSRSDGRVPKAPKPPDKPLLPYMRYSRKVWDSVKSQHPEAKLWEIGKMIGQMWRELDDRDKQLYIDEYETEKMDYSEQVKAYHNSPGYQAYLSAKSRSRDAPPLEDEPRFALQPNDEDEEDEAFSIKQVSAARFHRNHRLVGEIFSDTAVPELRAIVNQQRMEVLKRQVQSLEAHQKNLETELDSIESAFDTKKRKIEDDASKYGEELRRLCARAISEEERDTFYRKHYDMLLRQWSQKTEPRPNEDEPGAEQEQEQDEVQDEVQDEEQDQQQEQEQEGEVESAAEGSPECE